MYNPIDLYNRFNGSLKAVASSSEKNAGEQHRICISTAERGNPFRKGRVADRVSAAGASQPAFPSAAVAAQSGDAPSIQRG